MAAASALDFESTSKQYVIIGDKEVLDLASGDFTVEAWMKMESSGLTKVLVNKDPTGNAAKWHFFHHSTNKFYFQIYNGSYVSVLTTNTYTDTTSWYHVAATYDSATTTMQLWINGTADGTNTTGANPPANTAPVCIGASSGIANYMDGIVQCVRISNNVRYTSNFTPSTTLFTNDANTLGLWKLNENTGTIAVDSSSNGNNGTLSPTGAEPTWVAGYLSEGAAVDYLDVSYIGGVARGLEVNQV